MRTGAIARHVCKVSIRATPKSLPTLGRASDTEASRQRLISRVNVQHASNVWTNVSPSRPPPALGHVISTMMRGEQIVVLPTKTKVRGKVEERRMRGGRA